MGLKENLRITIGEKIPNVLQRFSKVFGDPVDVPSDVARDLADPKRKEDTVRHMAGAGTVYGYREFANILTEMLSTGIYRRAFYRDCESALQHAYVSGSCEKYVDSAVGYNNLHNASVWVTSEDSKIENELNRFLDSIGIEERVRDWAGQLTAYGDFFIEPVGKMGLGVEYVDDSIHPADIERIDINGRLEGFVRTGLYGTKMYGRPVDVEAPWAYVHGRVFGVTRKLVNTTLGFFGEPEKRFSLEGQMFNRNRQFRVTTKYGVSIFTPAISIYKKLKLAEESVLLARMSRGVLWYLYKIKFTGNSNFQSMMEVVNEYSELLKRRQGFDTTNSAEYFKDKFTGLFGQVEDVFVPTSEDLDIEVEKLGGEANIKWIADVEMYEDRLLGALRTSKALLGITKDLPGSIGEGSASRISIDFARNAQRVQTSVRYLIKRLCQIHLAYKKMLVDPTRFTVNLAEISSAEEEELKNAMDSGVDVVTKMADMIQNVVGEERVMKRDLLDYLMRKFMKLDDFDMDRMIKLDRDEIASREVRDSFQRAGFRMIKEASDLMSYLPNNQMYRIGMNEGRLNVTRSTKIWTPRKITFMEDKEYEEKYANVSD